MFRTRLKELREDADKFQKDLAEILNVSQTAYSGYERGYRTISFEALCKLADFYGVSVDYLLYRTDEKEPYPKSEKLEKLKGLEK